MSESPVAHAASRSLKKAWVRLFRRRALRIGIAGRLGVAFAGVAILVAAANLFAQHGLTLASLTSAREAAPALSPTQWIRQSVAHASGAAAAAIDAFDRATEARMRADSGSTRSRLATVTGDLDREMRAYVAAASAFAEPANVEELRDSTREHLRRATELVRDADQRRALAKQYGSSLDDISRQVQASVGTPWKVLGRVVTRQWFVDLNQALDSIRLDSARLLAADSYDPTTLDAIRQSDERLSSILESRATVLKRSKGRQWIDGLQADLFRLRMLRGELVALDKRRVPDQAAFRTAGLALVNGIHVLDAGSRAGDIENNRTEVTPEGSVLAAELNDEGRLLLWISAAVLSLVLILSIAITVSIVRPVRRFIGAMDRLACGDSTARMPRGGIKEIDVLAAAFNQMAAKIAVYQRQLESKLSEGTLQLLHLQEHDPLTQLPNRRQLVSYLRQALESAARDGERLAVLFIDLDNFKTINDSMGHAFGDRLLVAIAGRICEVAGPTAFIARLGGDEFTVVCDPGVNACDASEIGSRLLRAFEGPLCVDGHELSIGISVGASVFPEHADNAEALLRAADAALFHAKASGRRRLSVSCPTQLEDVSSRFRIEQGLRQAIDRGEFELVFQPEVSVRTLSTSVLEALLRWRMPDGTNVSPALFLPVAEQSGLILEIGDWVLRRAIETTAGWYHEGRSDIRVAINVSARELLAQGFVDRVASLLERHRLPATCIELELTETAVQTDPATVEVLRAVRAKNIAVALDDFGTGYSSLASLEQLPLTRVKLDRSLISRIHTSARSLAIAQAITDLCRRLGLEVTAEGIEDPEQLPSLLPGKSMHLQGFLISKPMPAEQVMPLLKAMRSRMNALLRHAKSARGSPIAGVSSMAV